MPMPIAMSLTLLPFVEDDVRYWPTTTMTAPPSEMSSVGHNLGGVGCLSTTRLAIAVTRGYVF